MAAPSFTLLVNSCDKFEDTWEPCFKLLKANGVEAFDSDGIMLVTERTAEVAAEGLPVRCSRANREVEGRRTWSACLDDALAQLRTPLVLYIQDDYFMERPMDAETVNALARKMIDDPSIAHIGLTHQGSRGPFTPTADERLWSIGARAGYRISTQAGLWRVPTLRAYLRPEENGWMFEIYGTRRSWRETETFLTVNRDLPEPIEYVLTGIIKGRWHRAMPALFARYGIPMDFSKRGFYDEPPTLLRKWETFRTLLADPAGMAKGLRGM